ncbi:MAG: class I tRNA ligase family protein, partial [Phycisphaerales bacterium]|nr:class I tRNA ligase family protein [Phycisphaerales bacterium]
PPPPEAASLEAWALREFDRLSEGVRAAYAAYDFRAATQKLYDFCSDTLSSIYLAAVKDRLYCDRSESPRRRRTQRALWTMTDGLCRLLAPILPHTADEAWRALRGASDEGATVHTHAFLAPSGARADDAWAAFMAGRDRALVALEENRKSEGGIENPLDAGIALPDAEGAMSRLDPRDLADLLGVSRVSLEPGAKAPRVIDLRAEPRCERSWKRDGTVRRRSDGGMLSDRDAEAVGVS